MKRILQVEECTVPYSSYWLKDFSVGIHFTTEKPSKKAKICYNVPAGKVAEISVSLYKPYPVSEFEYELKYAAGPFGDISTIANENAEKGIEVYTNNGLVRSIIYLPTKKEREQFSYP